MSEDYGHGGDVYRAADILKRPARSILDFSASVNPLGPSKKVKAEMRTQMKYLGTYPDHVCRRLRRRIGQIYDVSPEIILCGNGSNELIHLLCRALRPGRVRVTAPGFSEYANAGRLAGAAIESVPLSEETGFRIDPSALAEGASGDDLIFMGNPNNPTGSLVSRDEILAAVDGSPALFVVDEAFMDFTDNPRGLIGDVAGRSNLVVVRSLTKFHALAGLRIGFGVFPEKIASVVNEHRDPWSVNHLAQRGAYVALGDKTYVKETRRWLDVEGRFLSARLKRAGLYVYERSANFFLVRHERAGELRNHLFSRGIILRDCSNFDGLDNRFLRIAVRSHKENARLVREIDFFFVKREKEDGEKTP